MARRGNGPGRGGPAKGAGIGKRPPFQNGNPGGSGRGHTSRAGDAQRAREVEQAERMKDLLDEIASTSRQDSARVAAATALLNRIEGMPVARRQISGPDGGPIETLVDTRPPIEELIRQTLAELANERANGGEAAQSQKILMQALP